MLYQLYETQRAMMEPFAEYARATSKMLSNPMWPNSQTTSGHLPVTFYRSTSDLPAFTDYSMRNRTYRYFTGKPLYAFGHGLSYTTFDYTNLRVARAAKGSLTVTVEVANTGARDGDDVVQLYATPPAASQPQEIRALCGFARVSLTKGAAQQVPIEVPATRLRYWDDAAKRYVVEPGDYELLIGAASDDIRQTLPFTITAR